MNTHNEKISRLHCDQTLFDAPSLLMWKKEEVLVVTVRALRQFFRHQVAPSLNTVAFARIRLVPVETLPTSCSATALGEAFCLGVALLQVRT